MVLNPIEARVLGCLLEKEVLTPDYYPLTLNSLLTACNQKSNREPVMDLEERDVAGALELLREKGLAVRIEQAGARVPKYRHHLAKLVPLETPERSVLAVLLLRGAQTAGQIKARTERMYPFETLAETQEAMTRLADGFEEPFAQPLPRQPGRKELRWCHLLSGEPEAVVEEGGGPRLEAATVAVMEERARFSHVDEEIAALRTEVAELREELAEVRSALEAFKASFG